MALNRKTGMNLWDWLGRLIYLPYSALMNAVDLVMNPLQARLGVHKMGYIFVLPNLLIFRQLS